MNPEWYYTADGGQHGPVTAADLKKLAREGTIHPEDLVWKSGTPNWVAAKSVKGLFATAAAKPEVEKADQTPANLEDSATELIEDLPQKKKPDNRLADRLSEIQRKQIKERSADPEDEEPEEDRPKRSSRARDRDDEDDEEEVRPKKRKRRRDDDDDEDDDDACPSRSRRNDDEDDYDDRPRRRNRRGNKSGTTPGTGLGIASMICGILGLVISGSSCFLGALCALGLIGNILSGILALVAVCLGFPALKTEGKGFGIAGLVTGILGLIPVLLTIVVLIFGVAVVGAGALAR